VGKRQACERNDKCLRKYRAKRQVSQKVQPSHVNRMCATGRVARRRLLQMRPQFYSWYLKGEDLGRPRPRQTDNIKLNLKIISREAID
jgi:hypothetical protein